MITLALSLGLLLQDPPITDWMQEAERLGRVSYNAGACAAFGMVDVTKEQVEREGNAFQRRAIVARTWSPVLLDAVSTGSDQAAAELEVMTAGFDDMPEAELQKRVVEIEDYLVDRCAEVVRVIPGAKVPED